MPYITECLSYIAEITYPISQSTRAVSVARCAEIALAVPDVSALDDW